MKLLSVVDLVHDGDDTHIVIYPYFDGPREIDDFKARVELAVSNIERSIFYKQSEEALKQAKEYEG